MNQRRRGQALLEYVLAILLCLGMASILEGAVKAGISKVWCLLAKDIVAGCPLSIGCAVPDDTVFAGCPK